MKINNKILTRLVLALAVAITAGFLRAPHVVQAAPATFTVNSDDGVYGTSYDVNPGDGVCETTTPGKCTLLAAITEANSNGNPGDQDIIEFNIPGTGPHTIYAGIFFDNTGERIY